MTTIFTGTGSGAVYTQMGNNGPPEDHFLSDGNTFWLSSGINKHTNFAIAEVFHPFTSQPGLGGLNICKPERAGDGVRRAVMCGSLDALLLKTIANVIIADGNAGNGILDGPGQPNNRWVSYVPSVFHHIWDYITLEIGTQQYDKIMGHQLAALDAMDGSVNFPLDNLIGGSLTTTACFGSQLKQNFMLDLPFWWREHETQLFPQIALSRYDMLFKFNARPLSSIIMQCNGYRTDGSDNLADYSGTVLPYYSNTPTLSNVALMFQYVYFDRPERQFFANSQIEYMFNYHQQNTDTTVSTGAASGSNISIRSTLNLPVTRIFWYFLSTEASNTHAWADWSGGLYKIIPQGTAGGQTGQLFADHSFTTAALTFNSQQRTPPGHPAMFYKDLQALHFGTRIPSQFVYQYNFGLNAKSHLHLGSFDASRIDNVTWVFARQGLLNAQSAVNTSVAGSITVTGHSSYYTDTQTAAGTWYMGANAKQFMKVGGGVAGVYYNG